MMRTEKEAARSGTRQARVIQVIETISVRGDGKETIMREVRQYWDFDGNLLSENDPLDPHVFDESAK